MTEKQKILQCIVQSLTDDFTVLLNAARAAYEDSIHAENLPDNKYDTLSLEASYLAQGQANRAQEIKAALEAYRKLELLAFAAGSRVRLTALVTLEDEEGATKRLFLGPAAGGLKVSHERGEVVVITPESPLGRQLLGKAAGDAVAVSAGRVRKEFDIVDII